MMTKRKILFLRPQPVSVPAHRPTYLFPLNAEWQQIIHMPKLLSIFPAFFLSSNQVRVSNEGHIFTLRAAEIAAHSYQTNQNQSSQASKCYFSCVLLCADNMVVVLVS